MSEANDYMNSKAFSHGRDEAHDALKAYPRDNALEAAKDKKVLSLVWKAAFGNERLSAPDMALVAHAFLAIASELEWREQCIAESANSTTLGQPWSAMSSAERAAFNQGYSQAEHDHAKTRAK